MRILSSLLLVILCAPAAIADSQQQGQLAARQQTDIPFQLDRGEYLRGQFKATDSLDSATLIDPANSTYRQLLLAPERNGRFQIMASQPGTYRLRLQAADQPVDYEITVSARYQNTDRPATNSEATLLHAPSDSSPLLQQAAQIWQQQRDSATFWSQIEALGTPLIEAAPGSSDKKLVTFLYRGAQRNVRLFGSPIGDHDPLYQLADSDIWYRSYLLPADSRMAYRIAPDLPMLPDANGKNRVALLSTAQQDPLNKHPWNFHKRQDRFSTDSTLTLPGARPERWLEPNKSQGQMTQFRFASEILGNTRTITLYRPVGAVAGNDNTPFLFFFDGKAYRSKIPTPAILDNLIAEGRIPPSIAIFIDNPDRASRSRELPCNPQFADFLAHELLPWAEQQTGLTAQPQRTLLSGSSYGGLASACSAFRHPDKFGLVLSQSGSFWWGPEFGQSPDFRHEWLSAEFARHDRKPIRFYMNAGLFERGWQPMDILPSNRHLYNVLTAKGYEVKYEETASGHDYFHWRVMLPYGLIHLLGEDGG